MNFEDAKRQIASMEHSLNKARATALLAPNDPDLIELERILATKIEDLDNARRNADFENLFFADIEEEDSEVRRFR